MVLEKAEELEFDLGVFNVSGEADDIEMVFDQDTTSFGILAAGRRC